MPAAFEIYSQLLQTSEVPELGPGPRSGRQEVRELNQAIDQAAQQAPLAAPYQELVRALILLWHDHFEPAHQIAQGVETPDGSYVHAILHRREPDYSNAKYWFRRVGSHAAYAPLAERVRPLLARSSNRALRNGPWDALAFVDACEEAESADHPEHDLLRLVQAEEFKVLLQNLTT